MRIPSNKVQDIFYFAYAELKALYQKEEIDSFLFLLFDDFLGWNKAKVLSHKESTINQSDLLRFNFGIKDLKKEKPVQYITGKAFFYGLIFDVNEKVLIPRPETEELVEYILKENPKENLSVLDMGTGSGCIAITLAKFLKKPLVTAWEISIEAIETARLNAHKNKVDLHIVAQDMLQPGITSETQFDVIVSNPPYVCVSEKTDMKGNVLNHEPHSALFVPDKNPLLYYKAIANFARTGLNPLGKVYLEINEHLGMETQHLFEEKDFSTTLKKDMFGKDRFIVASKK